MQSLSYQLEVNYGNMAQLLLVISTDLLRVSPTTEAQLAPQSMWEMGTLTLQWMTTTCWGSLFSQDSCALHMVHILSRGGACSSGQPTSMICKEKELP